MIKNWLLKIVDECWTRYLYMFIKINNMDLNNLKGRILLVTSSPCF